MKGLYKGKYLIAIYDEDDYLVDVSETPSELEYKSKCGLYSIISRLKNHEGLHKRIYLIDCTEKNNDIFAEEDDLFLQFVEKKRVPSGKEESQRLGVSERTYFRHKAKGTLYKLENKLKQRSDL